MIGEAIVISCLISLCLYLVYELLLPLFFTFELIISIDTWIDIFIGISSIVGVCISVNAAYSQYHDDHVNNVRPYLGITVLKENEIQHNDDPIMNAANSSLETQESNVCWHLEPNYPEGYFSIKENEVSFQDSLTKKQYDTIVNRGFKAVAEEDNIDVYDTAYRYCGLFIRNVGNGAAINTAVELYEKNARLFKPAKFIFVVDNTKEDRFYVGIYCDCLDKIQGKEYYLVFAYQDIYGNDYGQRYIVRCKTLMNGNLTLTVNISDELTDKNKKIS